MPPQKRKLHDKYFKMAKAEGYAARSAYKLIEINQRHRILKRGMRVLDLGCAPGSWLQVAADRVGQGGMVTGLDLQRVNLELPPNVRVLQGDIFTYDPEALSMGEPFDVVLSDMAPNTTGAGDHFRSVALCRRILDLVPALLAHGGACVMKVFEGEVYPELLKETKIMFDEVKGLKPQATREVSPEMFVIATGYHAPREEDRPKRPTGPDAPAPKPPAPRPGWGAPPGAPGGSAGGAGGRR